MFTEKFSCQNELYRLPVLGCKYGCLNRYNLTFKFDKTGISQGIIRFSRILMSNFINPEMKKIGTGNKLYGKNYVFKVLNSPNYFYRHRLINYVPFSTKSGWFIKCLGLVIHHTAQRDVQFGIISCLSAKYLFSLAHISFYPWVCPIFCERVQ